MDILHESQGFKMLGLIETGDFLFVYNAPVLHFASPVNWTHSNNSIYPWIVSAICQWCGTSAIQSFPFDLVVNAIMDNNTLAVVPRKLKTRICIMWRRNLCGIFKKEKGGNFRGYGL